MQELFGTYRGFSPTDESGVGMGEMQVVIDDEGLTMSIATGLEIDEDVTHWSGIRNLSDEEIATEMKEGAIPPVGTRGIMLTDPGIKFIFVTDGEEIEGLIIIGMMSDDFFGPSFAFAPSQVKAGMFEKALQMMEEHYGILGCTPLLSHDGKAPNSVVSGTVGT